MPDTISRDNLTHRTMDRPWMESGIDTKLWTENTRHASVVVIDSPTEDVFLALQIGDDRTRVYTGPRSSRDKLLVELLASHGSSGSQAPLLTWMGIGTRGAGSVIGNPPVPVPPPPPGHPGPWKYLLEAAVHAHQIMEKSVERFVEAQRQHEKSGHHL